MESKNAKPRRIKLATSSTRKKKTNENHFSQVDPPRPGPKKFLKDRVARTFHLEQEDADRLYIHCYRSRITQNQFVRDAIKEKLDKEE